MSTKSMEVKQNPAERNGDQSAELIVDEDARKRLIAALAIETVAVASDARYAFEN